jgi:hypothetical protein
MTGLSITRYAELQSLRIEVVLTQSLSYWRHGAPEDAVRQQR